MTVPARPGPDDTWWPKALTHPTRVAILRYLLDRRLATPGELSGAVGVTVATASYHARVLCGLGCVELAKTTPKRGALQHHYRLRSPSETADVLRGFGLGDGSPPASSRSTEHHDAGVHERLSRVVQELRRRRQEQAISQAELARRVGIRPDYLGRIERGDADPHVSVLDALAIELGSSLGEAFSAFDS